MKDLTRRVGATATRSALWALGATVGGRALSLVSLTVLARLLAPEDFGLVAVALVFITYVETVGDLGAGMALIYWPSRRDDVARIAFIVNLVMGGVWFALTFALAPAVAAFFHNPEGVGILRTLAWSFPLKALGNTHDALCMKELRFKARLVPEVGMALIKATVAVGLAFAGFGVWSLVWGQLVGLGAWSLALWLVVPWRPRGPLAKDLLRPMLAYGRGIVSVNVLAAVVHHADLVVVGRMVGVVSLGYYHLAYKLPEMSLSVLLRVLSKVLFPSFAKLEARGENLRPFYLGVLRYVTLLVVPAAAALALLAEPAVGVFLGDGWTPAVPIVQALAVYTGLRALGTHVGDVLKAKGRPGLLAGLGVVKAAVLVPALIVAAHWGATAVAWAMAAAAVVAVLLNFFVACRSMDIRLGDIVAALRPGVAAGGATGLTLWLSTRLMPEAGDLWSLMGPALLGSIAYLMSVHSLCPELLRQVARSLFGGAGERPPILPDPLSRCGLLRPRAPVQVMAEIDRFLVPVHERGMVAYLLDSLLVPHGRRQKLLLPLWRRLSRWMAVPWIFRHSWQVAHHGDDGRSQPERFGEPCLAPDLWARELGLVATALSKGGADITRGTPLEQSRPLRWLLTRDYPGRHGRGRLVAFLFQQGERSPAAVLKLRHTTSPGRSLHQEWEALRYTSSLLPEELQASVPSPLAFAMASGVECVLLSWLPGRSAYVEMQRLVASRRQLERHFRSAALWLAGFHRATRRRGEVQGLDGRVGRLEARRRLQGDAGSRIPRRRYETLLARWREVSLPVVAAHGDFWARNLVLHPGNRIGAGVGVVDWEYSSPQAPPHEDLFHFALSYGLIYPWNGRRRSTPVEAFRLTFLDDNHLSRQVWRYFDLYCESCSLDPDLLKLLLHHYLLRRWASDEGERGAVTANSWLDFHQALATSETSIFPR